MNFIYNLLTNLMQGLLAFIYSIRFVLPSKSKFYKFVEGQHQLLLTIRNGMLDLHSDGLSVVWIHAASLGEYGVARPVIQSIKKRMACHVVLTFFSSTGYEALQQRPHEADKIFYLPLDTRTQARAFLDIVRPSKAIFIISEYWINYLRALKDCSIPTFLISAVITPKAPFYKWYGGIFRQSLDSYKHFMVLDETSGKRLKSLGYENYTITGDPLFDNAIAVASTPYCDSIVEHFAKGKQVFIAGSISDKHDLALITHLANKHRDVRFLIVPHEISEETLRDIKFELEGYALCYSECDNDTNFSDTQSLIIDFLGALPYLYRYGTWAYVGGGFTPYLHSIIEATVYGLPVCFGPMIQRKVTPNELIQLGIGQVVESKAQIERWFGRLKDDTKQLLQIKDIATAYTRRNSSATSQVVSLICS